MAFVNRLGPTMAGQGAGRSNDAQLVRQNVALSGTAAQPTLIPISGSFSPPISRGKIRIKLSVATGTGVGVTAVAVLSDGTNYVQILSETVTGLGTPGTLAAPNGCERVRDFQTDLNGTSLTVTTTLTAGTVTMDVEVSGSS